MTLFEALETMTPLQIQFFEALDMELAKVQSFYREREKDALMRSGLIKEQLNELKDHRRIFHVCRPFILYLALTFVTYRPMKINRQESFSQRQLESWLRIFRPQCWDGGSEKMTLMMTLPFLVLLNPRAVLVLADRNHRSHGLIQMSIRMPRRN